MNKLAIVVIGYNRVNSISRLLKALSQAYYGTDKVDLIISIDNSGTDDVEDCAKKFHWEFGNKIIKTYPERLGLRKHVLTCGDYLRDYDAMTVLEDDIYVSPNFYNYMRQAVDFYKDEENIAGIALYSHLWNEYNSRPFVSAKSKYDVFFMQFAQSWGQIWMKKQWFAFREWYEKNSEPLNEQANIPRNVSDWPKSSWLKYHIKYCIENNKYFVYPYVALSTNFTDIGQHNTVKSTTYQIPMAYDIFSDYKFAAFTEDAGAAYYDAFFEREGMGKCIGIDDKELCVDLYGGKAKSLYKKYLLTMEKRDYKVLHSYALEFRPHEMNVMLAVPGNDIFLYDTLILEENENKKDEEIAKWYYDARANNYRIMAKVLYQKIISKISKNLYHK